MGYSNDYYSPKSYYESSKVSEVPSSMCYSSSKSTSSKSKLNELRDLLSEYMDVIDEITENELILEELQQKKKTLEDKIKASPIGEKLLLNFCIDINPKSKK